MFSGKNPFEELSHDFHVMNVVTQGRRPCLQLGPHARERGLTPSLEELIGICWDQMPDKCFMASKVVQHLHALPNRPADRWPPDNFTMPSPSLLMYKQAQHPFARLDIVSK